MRNFIVNLFFKYYFKDQHKEPLSDLEKDRLLAKLCNDKNLQLLPLYLDQLANNARNKYLYTNDPIFKGSIMAYTYLKNEITKKKSPEIKAELTKAEEVSKMKGRGY